MLCCFREYFISGKVCGNWKVQAEKSKISTQGLEYHIRDKKLVFCCNMSWVNIKSSHWRGQGHKQGWDSKNLISVLSVVDLLAEQLASRIKTNMESYEWDNTPLNVKLINIIHFFSENSFNRVLSTKYAIRTIGFVELGMLQWIRHGLCSRPEIRKCKYLLNASVEIRRRYCGITRNISTLGLWWQRKTVQVNNVRTDLKIR